MYILQDTPPHIAEMVISYSSCNRYATDTDVPYAFTTLKSLSKFWKLPLILGTINTGVTFQDHCTAKTLSGTVHFYSPLFHNSAFLLRSQWCLDLRWLTLDTCLQDTYQICCMSLLVFQADNRPASHENTLVHFYSHLASVHLSAAATAKRSISEHGIWMKSAWLQVQWCSFPDSIWVEKFPASFWLLICAELLFCLLLLCMCNTRFELLSISPCAFFCWTLLLLLHCPTHSNTTRLHIYATHN